MKNISLLILLIITVAALSGCIDQDQGKMQGGKAATEVTK
jgi:hypothetical protein